MSGPRARHGRAQSLGDLSLLPMSAKIRRSFRKQAPAAGTVNLSGQQLSARHARSVGKAMKKCGAQLQRLDLSHNALGLGGVQRVVRRLRRCPKLYQLDLRCTQLSKTDEASVAKMLAEDPPLGLTRLVGIELREHLEVMGLGDDLAVESNAAILRCLRGPQRIRQAFASVADLGKADLRHMGLWPHQMDLVAEEMTQAGMTLRALDLSGNPLGPHAMAQLARALRHCPQLEELRVDANTIGAEGLVTLLRGMRRCVHLARLRVGEHFLGSGVDEAVLRSLAEAPHPALERIDGLTLANGVHALGLPPHFAQLDNEEILACLRRGWSQGLPGDRYASEQGSTLGGMSERAASERSNSGRMSLDRGSFDVGPRKSGTPGLKRLRQSPLMEQGSFETLSGTPLSTTPANATTPPATPDGRPAVAGLPPRSPVPTGANPGRRDGDPATPSPFLRRRGLFRSPLAPPAAATPLLATPPAAAQRTEPELATTPSAAHSSGFFSSPGGVASTVSKPVAKRRDSFENLPPARGSTSSISSMTSTSTDGSLSDDAQATEIRRTFREAGDAGQVRLAPATLGAKHSRVVREELARIGARLKVIYFEGPALTPRTVQDIAAGLQHCPNVKTLWLDKSFMGDAGACTVAGALSACPELKMLWLGNNGIGDDGVLALLEATYDCPQLKIFNVADNYLTEEGEEAAARMLAAAPHPSLTQLEGIDLRYHVTAMGLPIELENYDNATILTWVRDQERMQLA